MDNTIREQIITAIIEHLQENWITDNDYNFTCNANIYRAIKNVNDDALPCAVVFPQQETSEMTRYGTSLQTMVLKVEAVSNFEDGINPSVTEEKLLGDIIKIMTSSGYVISELFESIYYTGGGTHEIADSENQHVGAYGEFQIKYQTVSGNPYSQS